MSETRVEAEGSLDEAESLEAAVELARTAAQAREAEVAADRDGAVEAEDWYYYPVDYPVDATPRTVLVERLPCLITQSDAAVEAMLQQAGLKQFMLSYQVSKVGKGKKALGALRITLVNELVAECCVQHFLGCTWVASKGLQGPVARILPKEPGDVDGSQSQGRVQPGDRPAELAGDVARAEPVQIPPSSSNADGRESVPKGQTSTSSAASKGRRALDSDSEQSTRDQSERHLASEGSDDDGLHVRARLNWADLCDEDEAEGKGRCPL